MANSVFLTLDPMRQQRMHVTNLTTKNQILTSAILKTMLVVRNARTNIYCIQTAPPRGFSLLLAMLPIVQTMESSVSAYTPNSHQQAQAQTLLINHGSAVSRWRHFIRTRGANLRTESISQILWYVNQCPCGRATHPLPGELHQGGITVVVHLWGKAPLPQPSTNPYDLCLWAWWTTGWSLRVACWINSIHR